MKKLIRHGVFETNSSSSHSISIGLEENKQFVLDTIYPNEDGVIEITGEEFGWGWFKHNDAFTKAQYAAQQFKNDEEGLNLIKEVIMEQTGAEDVVFNLEDGYIDHDSYGIVTLTKENLKNFIFDKNSWLFGGNDNSIPDPTFYHVSEIRDGKMINPKYKYELVIDGLDKTTKYMNIPTNEDIEDGIQALMDDMVLIGTLFVEDNIMWSLTRRDDLAYKFSYHVPQDYSANEIRFTKKDSSEYYQIRHRLESDPEYKKLDYQQKINLLYEEMCKTPNAVIKVKFNIKEI